MNRNMAGEWFSREELMDMAVECGAIRADQITRDMKTGVFWRLTAEHRLGMFFRGEAILDTRPMPSKPFVPIELDKEVLAFLGVEV
jgi:hypothetical protein